MYERVLNEPLFNLRSSFSVSLFYFSKLSLLNKMVCIIQQNIITNYYIDIAPCYFGRSFFFNCNSQCKQRMFINLINAAQPGKYLIYICFCIGKFYILKIKLFLKKNYFCLLSKEFIGETIH